MILSKNYRRSGSEASSIMIESLLLIGDSTGMEAVATAASGHARNIFAVDNLPSALSQAPQADLVIVFQHSPDEYPLAEILKLLNAIPLTRLIVCQGPWCSSYGRTRQFWPAAVCVDESRWLTRVEKELKVLSGECLPLPWTAGLDEIFAFDYGPDRKLS